MVDCTGLENRRRYGVQEYITLMMRIVVFTFSVRIFGDEDPNINLNDEKALGFLELLNDISFTLSNYDHYANFDNDLPLGFSGFNVFDEETNKSWLIYKSTVYEISAVKIKKGYDPNMKLESYLFNCLEDPIHKALATRPE